MNYSRINNPIVRLRWAGWESNTLALQAAGWELSAEEDLERWRMRLALYHPQLRMQAITQHMDSGTMRELNHARMMLHNIHGRDFEPELQIIHMAPQIQMITMRELNFNPFDAVPTLCQGPPRTLNDMRIFQPIKRAEQSIIIPERTVPELLEQILKMQDPKQREIREKRNREIRQMMREAVNIETGRLDERIAAEIIVGA